MQEILLAGAWVAVVEVMWNNLIINWILEVGKLLWGKSQKYLQSFGFEQLKISVALDMIANAKSWNHLFPKSSTPSSEQNEVHEWTTNSISPFSCSSPFIGENIVGIPVKTVQEVREVSQLALLVAVYLTLSLRVCIRSLNTHSSLSSVTSLCVHCQINQ